MDRLVVCSLNARAGWGERETEGGAHRREETIEGAGWGGGAAEAVMQDMETV
jgi:hypothetical protein